jgi:hypothetical protein
MSVADLYWAFKIVCDSDFRDDVAAALVDGEFTFSLDEMRAALRDKLVDAVCTEGADAMNRARRLAAARAKRARCE